MTRAPRATREETEKRIELCRALLRQGRTKSDIKRVFKKQYGLAHATTNGYISYARKRNQECLAKSEDEHLADSVSDWTSMRLQDEEAILQARRRIERANEALERCDAILSAENSTQDARDRAVEDKKVSQEIIEVSLQQIGSSRHSIKNCRRELDRLLGNHAPQKIASTTKSGHDVNKPATSDPIVSTDVEVSEMFESVLSRAKGSDDAKANGHFRINGNGSHK